MDFYGLLLVVLVCVSLRVGKAQVKPFLINCGSKSSTIVDGRKWVGDVVPGSNFTLSSPGIIASVPSVDGESRYGNLYKTARIFNTTSTYNFSVASGTYYLRLHYYPISVGNFNGNDSSFEVMANNLKLVSKFNIPSEILWKNSRSNSKLTSLVKEYFINLNSDDLRVEFIPESGSFALVSAIEVIPVLDELFTDSMNKVGGSGGKNPVSLGDNGLETMYRLNVGGPEIESGDDVNFWRYWESDERFMFNADAATNISNTSNVSYASMNDSSIAPLQVYETARTTVNNQVVEKRFNVSWKFDVDPNFDYLVRMHFCEIFYNKPNQRIFKIYINNKTAAENYDVFDHAGGMNKAYHEDFIDTVPQQVNTMWLQLGSDALTSGADTDALLNGLEIFKVGHNGNLAHVLSRIDTGGGGGVTDGNKSKNKTVLVPVIIGIAILLAIVVICVGTICFYIRKKKANNVKERPPGWRSLFLHGSMASPTNARGSKLHLYANGSMAANRMGRMFALAELRTATNNFDESLVIGTGGFGKVFKGEIEGVPVAIKRANPQSQQGLKEFETEIDMLSKLRHRHLVPMIGYCEEQNEMILVYEYMANGTLRSHLFGGDFPPLTWKRRLEVCIGAARGLHYLHTGADRGIIHRDVKTTNILLDEDFIAKMADFGLSKDGPALDQTHVSTAVKGSFGYLDPEYFRRQQLTQKSDVYSFGVVLFEVICARPVINPTLPRDQINLAEWALRMKRQGSLESIVDSQLKGYSLESLMKFAEIAEKCLADEGKDRPTMGEVSWHLEQVLQLHEASQRGDVESLVETVDISSSHPQLHEGEEEAILEAVDINEKSTEVKDEGY